MGAFENFFRDLGGQIESSFTPDKIIDALNPLNGIEQMVGTVGHGIDTIGGVVNNTVNKASSVFTSLIDMLPLILIGGGAIFLLTKSK